MLEVVSLEDAERLISHAFGFRVTRETVPLEQAAGRVIAVWVQAFDGVPPFDRSTVDGFAVVASDTFGCSDALPALLDLTGEVLMGEDAGCVCRPGSCVRIPTGGMVPVGADAVVMLEYCEEYGDGTIGVAKPVAPGDNIVFKHDDVKPGQELISAGNRLLPHHIGTLASLGYTEIEVFQPIRVGIISTGDEIVPVGQKPVASQMRDVNAPMLAAAVEACGAKAVRFPIVPDRFDALLATVTEALSTCDMVLVSGGSSAGEKDNTARVLKQLGTLLFHGVAVKPGKPTMCASVDRKPVFGLPGHPMAAYFMFLKLVRPLLLRATRASLVQTQVEAVLSAGIPSNHGRSELVPVRLEPREPGKPSAAVPVRSKSGLISQLSDAHGFVEIGRNQEGLAAGATVTVHLF